MGDWRYLLPFSIESRNRERKKKDAKKRKELHSTQGIALRVNFFREIQENLRYP